MTGRRDVIVFAPGTPDLVVAKATAALDAAEPWLPLGRLGQMNDAGVGLPITIRWYTPPERVNWQGQSDYSEIRLNATSFTPDGGWEPTLIHECVHVLDKHCLTPADRDMVMACVTGCLARVNDVCTQPLEPVWWDVIYSKECGELLAFVAAQHIWYALIQGGGRGADMDAFGYYTFDVDVTIPVILDVLAGPVVETPPITPQAPPPTLEDPTMLVKKWIYAEGADLLAAMSAARASGAAVVTNRGEAAALIKAGATITVIGGPACTALALTWAVTGKATTQGAVTAVLGRDYGDGLRLALAS